MISHLMFKSGESYSSLLKIPMNILIDLYKQISKHYETHIDLLLSPYKKQKK